ncbi:4-hydroxy-tetrahydrodipicolinate reductase [Leptolyngbya sp. 15MV]|nr:4-hydroxy-tetrahydrodipicolinate reductase [Leptolyngbya sp. 15MV]
MSNQSSSASSSTSSRAPSAVRVIVNGARGRMGSLVCALARSDARFALIGALDRAGETDAGARTVAARGVEAGAIAHDPDAITPGCADVVIDFSSPEGAASAIAVARRAGAALLVGTTGLDDALRAKLREESRSRAVMLAPNTSTGIATLSTLVRRAAEMLGASAEVSIVEAHHSKKKDAPSGTAIRLVEALAEAGVRVPASQVLSIRGGDVIGEHTVRLAMAGEVVELTHRATSREVFAHGALRAAEFLARAGPGWWTMH